MARTPRTPPPPTGPFVLTDSKDNFRSTLERQLEAGRKIQTDIAAIRNEPDYESLQSRFQKWDDFNETFLASAFTDDRKLTDYSYATGTMRITSNLRGQVDNFRNRVSAKITAVDSFLGQIDLFKEPPMTASASPSAQPEKNAGPSNKKVFVVHGHDRKKRDEVELALHQLKLEPIILENQASGGLTIIEKLERDSKEASYAVIIATADDEGHPKGKPDQIKPRARQNVVLELGAFIFALGRQNVAVLCDEGLEHPSDIAGLIYITLDSGGRWKQLLGRELQHAGFDIDLSKLS